MIRNQEKLFAAVHALQIVLIKARTYAYDKSSYTKIADILDRAEYLAALIYDSDDQTNAFKSYLAETASSHNCTNALEIFDDDLS